MRSVIGRTITSLLAIVLLHSGAQAAEVGPLRSSMIVWLESRQMPDGAWNGGGRRDALVTAEVLHALAVAGRSQGAPARRAIAWLLNHEYENLDYQARAVRALAAAGVSVRGWGQELADMGSGAEGYGLVGAGEPTSYDTALVLSAIQAAGISPPVETAAMVSEVLARRRSDSGWAGDGIPVDGDSPSDRTVTGEIVRALAGLATSGELLPSLQFLGSDPGVGGEAPSSATSTLEVATRLVALHTAGGVDEALLLELRDDARSWSTDPYVGAKGLLALVTRSDLDFGSDCPGDRDCDGVANFFDAFPDDPTETVDSDGDGLGDNYADPDLDGDGVLNSADFRPADPTESADTDGDGIGDRADADDDGDGLLDEDERTRGTDPRQPDTDGDGTEDGADPCPTLAYGVDADGDGVCWPIDECDTRPHAFDIADLDGDGLCDGEDGDDDGDGFDDVDELAAGTDPRDDASTPAALLASTADFDRDGLENALEESLGLSPFRKDTDSDGATDLTELEDAGGGTDPAAALDPGQQPAAVIAAFGGSGTAIGVTLPRMPPFAKDAAGILLASMTGGQSTPPGRQEGVASDLALPELVLTAGLQPQLLLGGDADGDGLAGLDENGLGTSPTRVDSDGDGFADGSGGHVGVDAYPEGYDLDGDSFVDGEADLGTDPTDAANHAGMTGDVAPLSHPDATVNAADVVVLLRIAADPEGALQGLSDDQRALTEQAANVVDPPDVAANDALVLLSWVAEDASGPLDPGAGADSDRDGYLDREDNCASVANDQSDRDLDGVGDACDNCLDDANSAQGDVDGDLLGDACDEDDDGDLWVDAGDNCPSTFNPQQEDGDGDGVGDACE